MKVIVLNQPGGTEELNYVSLDIPPIQPHEVLVKVGAISMNPVDIKTRAGKGLHGRLADENPLILGWDISGTVFETDFIPAINIYYDLRILFDIKCFFHLSR